MISETASQNTTVSCCFDLPALETQDVASCQTVKICVDWFNHVAKHGWFLIKSKYSFIICPRNPTRRSLSNRIRDITHSIFVSCHL